MAIFLAPVTIGAISAVLAALISITDRIVNNYGDCVIDINGGKRRLTVKGGSPMMSLLASQGIFVPSACGGKGSCGECKVKVLSDIGPILPTEVPYLTEEQQAENIRLSCQIKVKSDVAIQIPESLFNIRKYSGEVTSMRDLTYDIKEVRIALNNPASIDFTAGQYCQIVVPPYGKIRDTNQRAYSMSSKPSDTGELEFLIRLVPNGIATTYVHTMLNEGDKIQCVGPFGEFMVRDTDTTMICVAGGSGMAPFKSILYDRFEKGLNDRDIWYFFGARTKKDLFYLDEMQELQDKWPCFHFVAALSEPQEEDEWEGETGLITDVLNRYFQNTVSKDKPMEGYLCGSPGMINACIKVMNQNGITEDRIFFDKFA